MTVCEKFDKKAFIKFLKEVGIDINTHTKARGNQGIFFKNRIDVSKKLSEERQLQVMAHEFAHYIHSKIEPDMNKTKGSLEKLFCTNNIDIIEQELKELTLAIDENAKLKTLKAMKAKLVKEAKEQEILIKNSFPNFKRSEKFKEFERYIKKSKARFLLKHDRIKYITPFLRRVELYSIDKIEQDFPDMPDAFCAYLRLHSLQKKRARISARIRKYQKYYDAPNELFARFIESFFVDKNFAQKIAPKTCERFFELILSGHYIELKNLFYMANLYKKCD